MCHSAGVRDRTGCHYRVLEELLSGKNDCFADTEAWVKISRTHLKTLGQALYTAIHHSTGRGGDWGSLGPAVYQASFWFSEELVSIGRMWHLMPCTGPHTCMCVHAQTQSAVPDAMHRAMHLNMCACANVDSFSTFVYIAYSKSIRELL